LDTGKETIRPEDISKYLKELFALKLNGMQIRALFKAEEDSMNKRVGIVCIIINTLINCYPQAACAELPYVNKIGVRAHSNAPGGFFGFFFFHHNINFADTSRFSTSGLGSNL
jgi:hypothetical protein